MRALAAVCVGYLAACVVIVQGILIAAALPVIQSGRSDMSLMLPSWQDLSELLPVALLLSAPGFAVLRGLLFQQRVVHLGLFAIAGGVNAVLATAILGGQPVFDWTLVTIGLAAGVAQWAVERLVNRGPVVMRAGTS